MLRDEDGAIIFSACHELRICDNALQVELEACREGIQLALQWTTKPIIVELDCTDAVKMIQDPACDRSRYMPFIGETESLISEDREIAMRRTQNRTSHADS